MKRIVSIITIFALMGFVGFFNTPTIHADTATTTTTGITSTSNTTTSTNPTITNILNNSTATSTNTSNATTSITSISVDTVAPTVPTGLSATTNTVTGTTSTSSYITLAWMASTDNVGVTGYKVWRDSSQIGTTTNTYFTDNTIPSGSTYNYSVSAFDSAGNNSASATFVTITAGSGYTIGTTPIPTTGVTGTSSTTSTSTDMTAPTIPTGLMGMAATMASTSTSTNIILTWNPSTDNVGVVGYRLFRNGAQVGAPTITTYTDMVLATSTYSYMVSAFDAAGNNSGTSSTITVSAGSGTSSTSTPGTGTTTPPTTSTGSTTSPTWGGAWGWIVLPTSLVHNWNGSATSTAPSSPFTMNSGYLMFNGNYLDCNGTMDNDSAHHSTNMNDMDPAHHVGYNCPSNSPVFTQNNMQGNNPSPFNALWMQGMGGMPSMSNSNWVFIPITNANLSTLSGIISQFMMDHHK